MRDGMNGKPTLLTPSVNHNNNNNNSDKYSRDGEAKQMKKKTVCIGMRMTISVEYIAPIGIYGYDRN